MKFASHFIGQAFHEVNISQGKQIIMNPPANPPQADRNNVFCLLIGKIIIRQHYTGRHHLKKSLAEIAKITNYGECFDH